MIKNTRHKYYFSRKCCSLIRCIFLAILAARSSVLIWQRSNSIVGFDLLVSCKELFNHATTSALMDRSFSFAKAFSCASKSCGKRSVNLAKSVCAFMGKKIHQCFKSDVNLMSLFCQKGGVFACRFNLTIASFALMISTAYSPENYPKFS